MKHVAVIYMYESGTGREKCTVVIIITPCRSGAAQAIETTIKIEIARSYVLRALVLRT